MTDGCTPHTAPATSAVRTGSPHGPAPPGLDALGFSTLARALGTESRALGLTVPVFRSPPRLPGADRSLRRRHEGSAVVAVRRRDRPAAAVVADMVDGVIASNGLTGPAATEARARLWAAAQGGDAVAA